MVLVETGVEVADDDRRATAGDRIRLGCVDLPHVPLQRRSGSTPAGAFGRSPGEASAAASTAGVSLATALVEAATDSIRLSFANACANVALSDLAIATPMAS